MADDRKIRGTREWAVAGVNCCIGCPHGCRYCYARYNNVVKNAVVDEDNWAKPHIRSVDVVKDYPLYPGTVMFPTEHDIHPEILDVCLVVLRKLIDAGNRVLVVSKPHLSCIEKICRTFAQSKEQILFRFTITAKDNTILKFWEPGAPSFEERLSSLCYACNHGYQTSVSIEPMLECENIIAIIDELAPCVTHSIWLGRMNKIDLRVNSDSAEIRKEIQRIRRNQSDEKINKLYGKLSRNPLIRWKESIKEVVGLELARQPGLDL